MARCSCKPSDLMALNSQKWLLIPKGRIPFFGPFWKFEQAIVDAIFVQKISNSW
jgi:lysozyme family protein